MGYVKCKSGFKYWTTSQKKINYFCTFSDHFSLGYIMVFRPTFCPSLNNRNRPNELWLALSQGDAPFLDYEAKRNGNDPFYNTILRSEAMYSDLERCIHRTKTLYHKQCIHCSIRWIHPIWYDGYIVLYAVSIVVYPSLWCIHRIIQCIHCIIRCIHHSLS